MITQQLRDMLDDLRMGGVSAADLDAELDRVEEALGLPVTTPNDERE
ncbi:hypothetical protein [Arthrobacter pityocampae]